MRGRLLTGVMTAALAMITVIACAQEPIAHWKMEEIGPGNVVADVTGNGYDATAHGTNGTVPDVVDGIAGRALQFHRELEQYLLVDQIDRLQAPEQLTVMAWIKPLQRQGAHGIIGNKSDRSGDPPWPGWRFRYFWARVILQFGNAEGEEPGVSSENWSVMPGFWHHVTAVYDGERARIYINCELAAEAEVDGPIMPRDRPFVIGNFVGRKNAYAFEGMIDELRVYDRALTAEEIFLAAVEGMPE